MLIPAIRYRDCKSAPVFDTGGLGRPERAVVGDVAAPAEIAMPQGEQPHGGTGFCRRDPDGDLRTPGEHDPMAGP